MCTHKWIEKVIKRYDDWNIDCSVEVRERRCIFCGKKKREVVYVKDPSRRVLPKFIKDDLSDM